jgi:predicted CXXCH cytochrome family protein
MSRNNFQRICFVVIVIFATLMISLAPNRATVQSEYIGSVACAKCHESIARRYAATPMARTSGVIGDDFRPGEFDHAASGVQYRARREGSAAFLEFERRKPEPGLRPLKGRRKLEYFIGSGAEGRSFLIEQNRYLFQAPATWYAQKNRWDSSPGYENDREVRLNRPIDANCLYCHASQVRPIYGSQNRFTNPPFVEGGVSCERCHGPGADHLRTNGKQALINPARLEPARRDAVCAQCHLAGEARVEKPGRKMAFYRPGDALSDVVSFFVLSGEDRQGLKVNSHVEHLAQSVCAKQSGPSMSCTSCHDPHSTPAPAERAAYFRAKCLACHKTERLPINRDHSAGVDCTVCHMPRARASDGGHSVMTDHSIPRRPSVGEQLQPGTAPSAPISLIAFPGYSADGRSLGLAYAELWSRTGASFYEAEALRLLESALPRRGEPITDAELLTRLAHLIETRGESGRALAMYEAALKLDPHRIVAAVNAGTLYASQGNLDRAVSLWRDVLSQNPGLTEASANLALALRARGDKTAAAETLRQALLYAPDHPRLQSLLSAGR